MFHEFGSAGGIFEALLGNFPEDADRIMIRLSPEFRIKGTKETGEIGCPALDKVVGQFAEAIQDFRQAGHDGIGGKRRNFHGVEMELYEKRF